MSISWPLERSKDHRAKLGMSAADRYKLWFAEWGVLILVSGSLAISASFVSVAATWLAILRQGRCSSHWYLPRHVCGDDDWQDWPRPVGVFIYVALSLVYASGAALIVKLAPNAVLSGISELKSYFQGFDLPGFMNWRVIFIKLYGSGLVAASGLWLGQEAPMVHVAAAATSVMSTILPISKARRRDLILASTAAGLSVALSAPLGGVMFGLETFMPSKSVVWKMFVCSMVATVLLRSIVAPSSASGGIVVPETGLFHVSYDRVWLGVELLPFALLGVAGGIYGAFVAKVANIPSQFYAQRGWQAVVGVTMLTSLLSYCTLPSTIPSTELLANLFAECRGDDTESMFCKDGGHVGGLVYTLLLGSLVAPLSFSLRLPSGILFPSLVIGALLGRLVGLAMRAILESLPVVLSSSFCPDASQHCITPGVYALVGAGAVLTGVTRLTISSVVLMFEITGALSFIVPIMTGVIVSKWVSDTLSRSRSVYSTWVLDLQLPMLPDSSQTVPDLYASELMTPHGRVERIDASPDDAAQQRTLPGAEHFSVPILGPKRKYVDLVIAKTGQPEPTIVLTPQASLKRVLMAMTQLGVRVVVLCTLGTFEGLITRSDVVKVLNSAPVAAVASVDASEFEIDDEV